MKSTEVSKKRRRESEGDSNKPKKKKKKTTEQEGDKKEKKMVKQKVQQKSAADKRKEKFEKKKPVVEEKKTVEKKKTPEKKAGGKKKTPEKKAGGKKKTPEKKAGAKKDQKKEVNEKKKKAEKKEKEEKSEEEEEEEDQEVDGYDYGDGAVGGRVADISDDDSDDDDSDDDDDDVEDEGEKLGMDPLDPNEDMTEVNVDFEFFDLGEDDYHFVKRFLSSYIDGMSCTELSDFLVKEESVGTAIRVDEACFGFISLINLHHPRTKDMKGLKTMKDYILRSVQGSKEKHAALSELLNNQKVTEYFTSSSSSSSSSSSPPSGKATVTLVLNERVANCPEQLALPLHQNFWDEIDYAVENEDDEESGSKSSGEGYFRSDYYIMVSKVSDDNPHVLQQRGKGEAKLGKTSVMDSEEASFLKLEDEIYTKHALMKYKGVQKKGESKVIVLFERSQIPAIMEDLRKSSAEA